MANEEFDLGAAIAEEAEKLANGEETDVEETAEIEEEPLEAGSESDEEVEAAVEEEAEVTAESEEPEEVEEPEGLQPLEHWSEDVKEAFSRVDPEAQQAWIDQHKTFQRGYNELVEKSKGFEQEISGFSEVNNILKEFEPMWRAQGMNVAQGVGQLTQWAYALAANPTEVLPQLAEMYGVQLGELVKEAPYVAPEDRARDQRMNQLEQQIQQQSQAEVQRQQQQLIGQIEAFRDEVDADGNQLHEHFDDVIDQITGMYQRGFEGNLSEAYEQACWTNPEVRQNMISGIQKSTVKETAQQRATRAKRAQKASGQRVRQSQSPAHSNPTDDMGLEEMITHLAEQQVANG